jgi:hypothetical protein
MLERDMTTTVMSKMTPNTARRNLETAAGLTLAK